MLVNRAHPTVYFYRSRSGDFFDVARLKAAMAKALVAFYPLASRLGVGSRNGRPVIDCAGQGALFVVARSDLAVDDFSGFKPSPELRRLFVPRVDDYSPPVMCARVPLLPDVVRLLPGRRRGGGAGPRSRPHPPPRALPPVVHPDALTVFCPKLNLSTERSAGPVVSRAFDISRTWSPLSECVRQRRRQAHQHVLRRERPRVAVRVRGPPAAAGSHDPPHLPASVRRSLRPPLAASYFGNGIIWLGADGQVRDVASSEAWPPRPADQGRRPPDGRRAGALGDRLLRADGDGQQASAGPHGGDGLRVINWLGMPVYAADFGWEAAGDAARRDGARRVRLPHGGGQGAGSVRVVICTGCNPRRLPAPAICQDSGSGRCLT
ncbi:hypothetical protein ZWY2020_018329 [Hordeum vulgare]|nr:hypothetical protein ZWY2020_018329 [Hordeum vulgare]